MEKLPKFVVDRLGVTPALGHLDANILTAFSEKSLSKAERENVLKHLSRCGECREVVALSLPAIDDVQSTVNLAHRGWPALRLGLAFAGIVVIASFAAVLYQRRGPESTTASKAPQAVTEAKNVAPAASPADERAKLEGSQKAGGAGSQAAEPPAKIIETLPRAKEAVAGGAEEEQRDLNAPRPLPHGPRTTNQLSQWQQNSNGVTVGGPFPSAPPPPVANGQLVANQKAASEAAQVERASPSLDAQSQNQQALSVQSIPMPQQPARSGIADTRVDKAKPADTVASMVPPKVPAPYQAGAEKLVSAGTPVWSIDSAGRLERSFDQGNTFQQVDVKASPAAARFNAIAKSAAVAGKKDLARNEAQSNPIVFRAVAFNGMEVWAGGSAAQIYHSTDAGAHWSRVAPTSAGLTLTGDIVGIDFPDVLHGTITTSTPETWTTSDDGATWQKQ